ncbi:Kef-type K+ transport system membrane component KefB [Dysgonomonas sp. PH5-45]|uniref:cation:proton antiporter n=1 Tax=unclassified Dysgonomonas TaxID=2630389 RepID=UPI0024734B1E|nr:MULTISPECIES: cation:proton antiporter [unclassified Dysgonomonas]MDH6354344.1 Kef-type K+ transport system membrane component KefB [Dysgonomonas sp. PH5-45]MDH6387244.1 Kef-type K+ transport system membrane component KefB [Dysgonomonas sp. PH5-37]
MKKYKNLVYYVSVVGIFCLIMYLVLIKGENDLQIHKQLAEVKNHFSAWGMFLENVVSEATGATALLLLQIIVILFFVRFFGWVCQKIGQPTVIGEIIAGIVLGPSLLGWIFPEFSTVIFPESSIGNIKLLSEIGLVLFMFIVGMELDLKVLKHRINDAVLISHTCIALLFTLGIVLSYFIYPYFTYPDSYFVPFALFMGIAMSITAFPVLARIVHERGLNKAPLGAMVITCAAVDDITAWCLLAAVIAIAKAGTFVSSLFVILFAVIYVIAMFKVVRPLLKRIADQQTSKNIISKPVIGVFFLVLLLSSYLTSIIGIHPLFGAFLAGVIMPANMNFRKLFIDKIEDISMVVLLPLFFVYTGLNTKIGLLNTPSLWALCGVIVLIATFGKFIGGALASRFVGFNWKSSLTIGALMNTRGLMELVVLNIGYDLGILTPEIFAMLVVMALATTFLTSPLLNLIDRIFRNKPQEEVLPEQKKFKILVPFSNPQAGKKLMFVASFFVKRSHNASEVDMVHISPGNNLYQYNMEKEEHDIFEPIIAESALLEQPIKPIFKIASDPYMMIIKMGNSDEYDFILLGAHISIYKGNLLGEFISLSNKILHLPTHFYSWIAGKKKVAKARSFAEGTRSILTNSDMPVGIFHDKGLKDIKNVFIPILDNRDAFIGQFMERLAINSYARITIWDSVGLLDESLEFTKNIRNIKEVSPSLCHEWDKNLPVDADTLGKQDLVLVSINSWNKLKDKNIDWEKLLPSVLLLNE